jgi:hypothetical protein
LFSYIDLVRAEIAMEAGDRFSVHITDEETDGWRTLGDAARSVVRGTGGAVTEAQVFDWLRTLIAEGYGVSAELAPEDDLFGDYDRMTAWFARPGLHTLGDRRFAKKGDEPGVAPDPARDVGPGSP